MEDIQGLVDHVGQQTQNLRSEYSEDEEVTDFKR